MSEQITKHLTLMETLAKRSSCTVTWNVAGQCDRCQADLAPAHVYEDWLGVQMLCAACCPCASGKRTKESKLRANILPEYLKRYLQNATPIIP